MTNAAVQPGTGKLEMHSMFFCLGANHCSCVVAQVLIIAEQNGKFWCFFLLDKC
jgi:hypothetical protein